MLRALSNSMRQDKDQRAERNNVSTPVRNIFFVKNTYLLICLNLIVLFLIIVPPAINCQNINDSIKNNTKFPFAIKLPDGLYLFQPYLETRDLLFKGKDKNTLSPLFLVRNGKLDDPVAFAYKIGVSKFLNTYIKGKAFNVFNGSEMIGTTNKINLKPLDTCYSKEFLPDLQGKGMYVGKKLENYGGRGVMITPQSFNTFMTNPVYEVTDEDKAKVTEAIRKYLVPDAIEHINKILEKQGRRERIIGEGRSGIDRVEAFDLDGNGKKDFLGVYRYHGQSGPRAFWLVEFIFVFWDSGKIERISFAESSPGFLWGGIIDIDQDGKKEIIVQTLQSDNIDGSDQGKFIEIYSHTPSGWKRVYRSALTGCYLIDAK